MESKYFPSIYKLYEDVEVLKLLSFYREGKVREYHFPSDACLWYYKVFEWYNNKSSEEEIDKLLECCINNQRAKKRDLHMEYLYRHISQELEEIKEFILEESSLKQHKKDMICKGERVLCNIVSGIRNEAAHHMKDINKSADHSEYIDFYEKGRKILEIIAIYIIEDKIAEVLRGTDHLIYQGFSEQQIRDNNLAIAKAELKKCQNQNNDMVNNDKIDLEKVCIRMGQSLGSDEQYKKIAHSMSSCGYMMEYNADDMKQFRNTLAIKDFNEAVIEIEQRQIIKKWSQDGYTLI